MTKETFKYVMQPDGTEYFEQEIDELHKNYMADDSNKSNEGKMYATHGETYLIINSKLCFMTITNTSSKNCFLP